VFRDPRHATPPTALGVSAAANASTPRMAAPPKPIMGPASYGSRTQSADAADQAKGATTRVARPSAALPHFDAPGFALSFNLNALVPQRGQDRHVTGEDHG
jgi:hypothetical protein